MDDGIWEDGFLHGVLGGGGFLDGLVFYDGRRPAITTTYTPQGVFGIDTIDLQFDDMLDP